MPAGVTSRHGVGFPSHDHRRRRSPPFFADFLPPLFLALFLGFMSGLSLRPFFARPGIFAVDRARLVRLALLGVLRRRRDPALLPVPPV
jgi:hypothetical protein